MKSFKLSSLLSKKKNVSFNSFNKFSHQQQLRNINVCVVGSGPAGFYTTKELLSKFSDSQVTILEKLPTPYGLVRYGVAPDHPEVKNVQNDFEQIAKDKRVKFLGNVNFGKDITMEELKNIFDVIVLAYGAESERTLGIEGEKLAGVESARKFVAWYNGLPYAKSESEFTNIELNERYKHLLNTSNQSLIIGQGNVAMDVARILSRPVESLLPFDISDDCLGILKGFNVNMKKIYVVGRRGPVQIAATTKELRELTKLNCLYMNPQYLNPIDELSKEQLTKEGRVKQRLVQLLEKEATKIPPSDRIVELLFFKSPVAFLPSETDPTRVGGVRFEITRLERDDKGGDELKAVGTGQFEEIKCDLVFKSIGYKSISVDKSIPFDNKRGVVVNSLGRVKDSNTNQFISGLYVCGWLKRGPSGVILSNIYDAEETVGCIAEDVNNKNVLSKTTNSYENLTNVLKSKNISYITFEQYKRIEQYEVEQGKARGKIREKILTVEEMLELCKNN
ncbi:hypothetical protein ABK040_007479 [Willaertia magna]